jgi:hypothetical protein
MTSPAHRVGIGDAERIAAADHHAAGRLDLTGFDERTTAAWRARTRTDLDTRFCRASTCTTPQRLLRDAEQNASDRRPG